MHASSSAQSLKSAESLIVEINCSARSPMLTPLRRLVGSVAEELGFADEDLLKIEMAVDEACTNAVEHGRPAPDGGGAPKTHEIGLKVLANPECLTVEVSDRGQAKPCGWQGAETVTDYAAPGCEAYKGLGTLIMRQFMDEARFVTGKDGSRVTLSKRIPPRVPANG